MMMSSSRKRRGLQLGAYLPMETSSTPGRSLPLLLLPLSKT